MDKALIAQAAQRLRLRNLVLFESNLKRFREIEATSELGQQNKLSVRGEMGEAVEGERMFQLFRVYVELGSRLVIAPLQPEQEATPLFQIEAVFRVDYELTEEVVQDALQEFARFNAVHNVWPFWRQFVFSAANQAGLPCPDVPLRTDCLSEHGLQALTT
jgi:hypothetical protein